MAVGEEREQAEALAKRVRVGIVTALPEERAAMLAMFDRTYPWSFPGQGAGLVYDLGVLPAHGGGCHVVALALAAMGNNVAAARGTLLLAHFPEVEAILMTGIAGGVPSPSQSDDHVRLGDVVVSGERGVIQYDFVKKTRKVTKVRASPRPPHARLLEAVRLLESDALAGGRPWEVYVERAKHLEGAARPEAARDVLLASQKPFERVEHPVDRKRTDGQPRIFKGPIASGNVLLKDPVWRDRLRDQHDAKAVEMEGSGIADATWEHGVGYLVVRGICDYCDKNKNDDWHMYAAVVAAAYTRAVLGRMASGDEAETAQPKSAAAANREPPMAQLSKDTSPIWEGNNHPFEFRIREETATYTEMMRSLTHDVIKVHAHTHPVGVAAEHVWIRHNYPGSTMVTQALVPRELTIGNDAKKRILFDAIRIRLSSGREKDVWFDISSFFNGRSSLCENPGEFIAGKISELYASCASGESGASAPVPKAQPGGMSTSPLGAQPTHTPSVQSTERWRAEVVDALSEVLRYLDAAFPTAIWQPGDFYVAQTYSQTLATLVDLLDILAQKRPAFTTDDGRQLSLATSAVRRVVQLWTHGGRGDLHQDAASRSNPVAIIYNVVHRLLAREMSWMCPTCRKFGPWDGSRCLSCGRMSDD